MNKLTEEDLSSDRLDEKDSDNIARCRKEDSQKQKPTPATQYAQKQPVGASAAPPKASSTKSSRRSDSRAEGEPQQSKPKRKSSLKGSGGSDTGFIPPYSPETKMKRSQEPKKASEPLPAPRIRPTKEEGPAQREAELREALSKL